MLQLIYIVIFLLLSVVNVFGQTPNEYIGTWRWVGNQNDTFLVVLQQEKLTQADYSNVGLIKFFGKHSYSKAGKLVESNLNLNLDSVSDKITIVGLLAKKDAYYSILSENLAVSSEKSYIPLLQIGLTEIKRKQIFYFGTMQLISGEVNKARWLVERERPDITTSDDQKDMNPLIPTNIILQKISN